ncbi:MAG: penicillin acylase family protein, partial [Thermoanaerobaculia bacterium]|nr:penicillin acylase family protein [Thermoanaerobaculia bacterium]
MSRTRSLSLAVLAAGVLACTPADDAGRFDTTIRWTSHGIPHVTADDWGGLGYGFAYATATDAVCVIARDVVMVNGELSKFFGPQDGNLESDVFHRSILTAEEIRDFETTQSQRANQFSAGYVAGYNRYLRDHGDALPASCAGAAWVREIGAAD